MYGNDAARFYSHFLRLRVFAEFFTISREADMKTVGTLLLLIIGMHCRMALSQDFKRFEFHVSGGLTASGGIPLDPEKDTHNYSVHVNSSQNVGAGFAVNLNELDAVELYWQRQFTEGRLPAELVAPPATGDQSAFDLNIDQYHMNFIHHYEISVPRTKPYVMAGLGATTYRANGNGQSDARSYFSFSIGGGIKYYLNNHFGFRGEARWSPTLVSASDSSFWCQFGGSGAACLVNLSIALQHQMDLTGGLIFRF